MSTTKRILSGITPSSTKGLHIGNYFGAVKSHVEFQEKGECFYFIADYHALNSVFSGEELRNNIYQTFLDYLAFGIDTKKTTFFIESHVPEIFELTEILNNLISVGQMQRMHAYKDKMANPEDGQESINMGLFTYPILMAADILAFEPDLIPVGEDQKQHVEVARDISQAFNNRYGDVLKVPELFIKAQSARVLGTDGVRKMGKSLGNDITVFADPKVIEKQIMGIKTDPNRIHATDPGDPNKNVVFSYLELFGFDTNLLEDYRERYRAGTVGDVVLKKVLLEHFMSYFAQMRARREELAGDRNELLKIMKNGAEEAGKIAERTMKKVRDAIGALTLE